MAKAAATRIFHWQSFFIPSPVAVAQALGANWDLIMSNALQVIEEVAGGFVIGSITALVSAVLFVEFKTARHAFYPLAIAVQSIPIVCIAPILVDTLGEGYSSKVVLTAIIAFFPTLVNTVRGLAGCRAVAARSVSERSPASSWRVLWKLRLPNALPYIFVAFRITATTSVIGAIVAEWIGFPEGPGIPGHQLHLRVQESTALGGGLRFHDASSRGVLIDGAAGTDRSSLAGRRRSPAMTQTLPGDGGTVRGDAVTPARRRCNRDRSR